ncbi:MAG: glycosyltransferase [Proteobacteria bacterium]|nr:glycosyltransferase [Pseudomonadota bacterium]MBU1904957.1 glycosyltransferase [Pseudomonadota bacterium]
MKVLCVFGKYQYGDPSRGIGTEYVSFVPALKRLGHEVIHFESWNRKCYSNYAELNKALLTTVNREHPDVMLVVQLNYEIWLETLQSIQAAGDVATICWTTDDSFKYREVSRFIGSSYHVITTTYPEALPMYHRDRIHSVLLTQWAANSENLREPLAAKECEYQVSFVGAAHGDRKERIARLNDHGIGVSCFGYGWPSGPVAAEEIPQIMRKSIISLNFANSKGQNQIKARTFEVPGAGGFLLTEYAPGLEEFYSIGSEIDVFFKTEELVKKTGYYLSHPEKRDLVARAGFQRTVREHTYEIRMKEVLDFALSARDRYIAANKKPVMYSFDKLDRAHRVGSVSRLLREIIVLPCVLIWGEERGPRAARRLIFELSWRLFGKKTFTASGWPGRLFPEQ